VRYLFAFGRFWSDFVLGDDRRVAAAVVAILAIGAIGVVSGLAGSVLPLVLCAGLYVAFAVLTFRR
jgi:hypothetical protein